MIARPGPRPPTLRPHPLKAAEAGPEALADDTDITYSYDQYGNVLSATDSVTGDDQCYQYDYLDRLTAAWSQGTASCASGPPGASGIGGPAPYQQVISYDADGTADGSTSGTTGNITSSDLITGTGADATTTTDASYTYPGSAQPHAPASASTTLNGTKATTTNTWTAAGQLASTATGNGATTTYNWSGTGAPPDQLASVTTGSSTTTYRYDASGNLLLVDDGGTTTLYLPDTEVTASGSTVTATRYYTLGGQIIAARTSTSELSWLFGNSAGTATTSINAATQAVTRRYYTPFGVPRGTAPASWPGSRGFEGGTTDTFTGLTNLGAREYDPAAPGFISPDPVLNPEDPQDLNPYNYALNNPVTNSDPSGLCPRPVDGTCPPAGPGGNCGNGDPGGPGSGPGGPGPGPGGGPAPRTGPTGDVCTPSTCPLTSLSHLSPAQQFAETMMNGNPGAAQQERAIMDAYDNELSAAGHLKGDEQWALLLNVCRRFGCSQSVISTVTEQAFHGRVTSPSATTNFIFCAIPLLDGFCDAQATAQTAVGTAVDAKDHDYMGAAGLIALYLVTLPDEGADAAATDSDPADEQCATCTDLAKNAAGPLPARAHSSPAGKLFLLQ